MRISRTIALAILAIVGILLVFVCPASGGPFTVTNGPATVFRALVAAHAVFAAISTVLMLAILRQSFDRDCILLCDLDSTPPAVALRC
jgi:hypothetical protein